MKDAETIEKNLIITLTYWNTHHNDSIKLKRRGLSVLQKHF